MKKEVPLNQAKWIIEPGCVVLVAGTVTGRGIDKFAKVGLTPVPANVVTPPLVA